MNYIDRHDITLALTIDIGIDSGVAQYSCRRKGFLQNYSDINNIIG